MHVTKLLRAVALASSFGLAAIFAAAPKKEAKTDNAFRTTNVWEAHFKFTPDQWEAMPPEQAGGGMFGRGPGPGGGPGRSGPPGGAGAFGPAMFLAPVFSQADENHDSAISREELRRLGAKWFADWDKKSTGLLQEDDLREGLNRTFSGPPPGEPGGPGRGGMIPMLQGRPGTRNGLASAAGIDFKYVKGDLRIGDTSLPDVAVRYKGNGTWMASQFDKKRSLKVDLNEYVSGQKYAGDAKLNFHNCVTDASYMNEVLSYQLYRDAGVPAPRTAYARLYVDVPGKYRDEYFGLYSVVENIDSAFAHDRYGSKKGAIFKPVTRQPFEYLGDDWNGYQQTYDPKTDLTDREKRRLIEFCKLVSQATDDEFARQLGSYLDLDNFSRYMAVTVWLSTLDSILGIGQNYYVYLHPKTGKLSFIPWDLDHSFGQFFLMGSQEQREKLSITKPWQGENRFLERVFQTEEFQKLYRARLEEFSKTIFRPERFEAQVDQLAAVLRPNVKDESENHLERFDKAVAGEMLTPQFGPGPGGRGPGGGEGPRFGPPPGMPGMAGVKPIKAFVGPRAESVQRQLAGKEQGELLEVGFGPGGPGRPGGPGGFGPGNFLAPAFKQNMDTNKDGAVSRQEFSSTFDLWFQKWNKDGNESLSDEELRNGLNETFRPPGMGGAGGGPVILPLGNPPPGGPKP